MKISVVGAGNVGSTTALRLAQEGIGEIVLVDVIKGMSQAKAFDMEDARAILKLNYHVQGADDIQQIKDSDVVVITAGLPRKPGMTREELLSKNSEILKNICLEIKKIASHSIVIVVTNPLDLMTYYALKTTGFNPRKVLGMGITLDAARFANLISKELNVPVTDIDACVIGSHGENMLPLPRLTTVKKVALDELMDKGRIETLIKKTIGRGAEIVSLLGSGSAYFAPSAAVSELVKIIAKDEKRIVGACAYLNGEYGIKDICLGVPVRLGKDGLEQVVELDLTDSEKETLRQSAESLRKLISILPH